MAKRFYACLNEQPYPLYLDRDGAFTPRRNCAILFSSEAEALEALDDYENYGEGIVVAEDEYPPGWEIKEF